MSTISHDLVRRIGIWALIQALPDESALKAYLRAAFLGLSGVIIGSVLAGSALAAAMVALYNLMINQHIDPAVAGMTTAVGCVLTIVLCFYLAGLWFQKLVKIKEDLSIFKDIGGDVIGSAINSLAEGFLEGIVLSGSRPEPKESKEPAAETTSYARKSA